MPSRGLRRLEPKAGLPLAALRRVSPRAWSWARAEATTVGRLQAAAEQLPPNVILGGLREDFEQVGRLQLICLLREGLDPQSNVLDVGCGALRGGYWLIHFLDAGRYFGIEPTERLLELGRTRVLEPEVLELKQPRFDSNDRFDFSVFGTEFDFVLARSVWTHAARGHIQAMLDAFVATAPSGVMLASYVPAGRWWNREYLDTAWKRGRTSGSAGLARHRLSWIRSECTSRGLNVRELSHSVVRRQIWLRIEHARGAGAAQRAPLTAGHVGRG
jgi:SAM-dependent methyltransferase